jgi:hypothetical protein
LRAAIWVAAIGGLVLGHILWLAGISLAIATSSVSTWVLIVAATSFVLGAAAAAAGWSAYRRRTQESEVWAAFLLALPVAPVLLSIVVLGVTYL